MAVAGVRSAYRFACRITAEWTDLYYPAAAKWRRKAAAPVRLHVVDATLLWEADTVERAQIHYNCICDEAAPLRCANLSCARYVVEDSVAVLAADGQIYCSDGCLIAVTAESEAGS
jgi:hypothetical protein